MKLLSFGQAAQFLGKHKNTLEGYERRGVLKHDLKVGHRRYFKVESLEAFKKKIESLYSLDDIARMYNLSWEMAYHYFRVKRKVQMDNTLGKFLFTKESVEMVAKAEGWLNENSQSDQA